VQRGAKPLFRQADPVVVFCAYGFRVGSKTAPAPREAALGATYVPGGHSAWKAIGGATKMQA